MVQVNSERFRSLNDLRLDLPRVRLRSSPPDFFRRALMGFSERGSLKLGVSHRASLRRRKRRAIPGAPGQLPQGHRRVWVARLCARPASAPRGKRGGP